MGNFEKLSVLVIVVIIVMILVVALYTWSDGGEDPASMPAAAVSTDTLPIDDPLPAERKSEKKKDAAKDLAAKDPAKSTSDAMDKIFKDWPLAKSGKEDKAPPALNGEGSQPVPTPPPAPVGPQYVNYVVKDGDTLGKIAQEHLGGSSKWPEIIKANDGLDPLRLRPGMTIRLPVKGAASAEAGGDKALAGGNSSGGGPAKPGGSYSVLRGETLETISKKAYGTKNRWPEIWVANLALLDDPSDIRQGMTLQLPK